MKKKDLVVYDILVGIGQLKGGTFKSIKRIKYEGTLNRTQKEATKHLEALGGHLAKITHAGGEICTRERTNTGELRKWKHNPSYLWF